MTPMLAAIGFCLLGFVIKYYFLLFDFDQGAPSAIVVGTDQSPADAGDAIGLSTTLGGT
jgi:hypothetical protein